MVGPALLLASDAGSFITGQVILADGGMVPPTRSQGPGPPAPLASDERRPRARGVYRSAVAGEDEDFDVEAWNERFHASPSGPTSVPRVGTRRLHPSEPPDALGSEGFKDDLFGDPLEGTEAVVEEGFPAFEHNQWTVEGEIERFGAFGRGASASRGWKRWASPWACSPCCCCRS